MAIRFGVSPIAWSNDNLPELGGDTPLETCLADAAEVGFDGIELGKKFPRDAAELRPRLEKHALKLIGGWYSGSLLHNSVEEEIASLQPHLALLKAFNCSVFIFAECTYAIHSVIEKGMGKKPILGQKAWSRFGDRLTALAAYINQQGLRFAYHHHLGTVVQTASELRRLFAATSDEVGIVLDTGHAYVGGIDSVDIIARFPARIAHVHCKDVRGSVLADVRANNDSFLDGVLKGMFTVPGDGLISFTSILLALRKIDYRGWVVVEAEQDPSRAKPREYAQFGLKHLRTAQKAACLIEEDR